MTGPSSIYNQLLEALMHMYGGDYVSDLLDKPEVKFVAIALNRKPIDVSSDVVRFKIKLKERRNA